MKTLIIADIHANLAALEAVLSHEGAWDEVIFLGDAVGGGPQPEEVVRRLMELGTRRGAGGVWILGNHDQEVLAPPSDGEPPNQDLAYVRWTRQQLSDESLRFLASLTPTAPLDHQGLRMRLHHGEFRRPMGLLAAPARLGGRLRKAGAAYRRAVYPRWTSRIWPDTHESVFRNIARAFPEPFVLLAHSHVQFQRNAAGRVFINPGSVGQPRLGQPLAAYAVLEGGEFSLRAVGYDTEATCRALDRVPLDEGFKEGWRQAYRQGRLPPWYKMREWESLAGAGYR